MSTDQDEPESLQVKSENISKDAEPAKGAKKMADSDNFDAAMKNEMQNEQNPRSDEKSEKVPKIETKSKV